MGAVSTTRTYDARNLPLKNTRSNGVTSSYSYDAVGRLLAISEQAGNTTLFSRAFNYDAVGNIVGNAADMGLPLATPAATATFDAASEVTAFGGTTYTTDADGNRLTETSAAGTTAYSWDSRGRLQSILAPGGALTSFVYDPGGNMIQQQVSSAGQITLQRFIWDDADNVVSIAQGQTVTSILDGRGVDDVIAAVQGGVPQLPLLDQVSSEGAFTDGTGHVVGREFYEPYGASTSSGAVGQFLYAGRPSFNGNLFYNRARFYDSTSGRFLSEDPMGLDGGSKNLYRYGDNSPISSSDPYGLDVWVEHGTHDQAFGIHQKICVGQYGMRGGQSQAQCYSFGLSGDGLSGRFPAGGDGEFGPDDIRSYRRVSGLFKQQTHQQDQKTIEGLMKLDNKHAPYFLIGANCIVVAKMLFDSVMEDGGLPPDTHLPGYTDDAVRAGKWVLQTDYQIFKAVVPGGFLLR
jgi:RHS repeat-associated protein